MMSNYGYHYEQAFEDFLLLRNMQYVPINQTRKALFADVKIKSFDYIIYPKNKPNILIDLKGRKCSCSAFLRNRTGPSWLPREDIEDLKKWETIFGPDHLAVYVFAYWLHDAPALIADYQVHHYNHQNYSFLTAELEHYIQHMKPRSQRWNTVFVPSKPFTQLTRPFNLFIK
jgi:hypothetical protein